MKQKVPVHLKADQLAGKLSDIILKTALGIA